MKMIFKKGKNEYSFAKNAKEKNTPGLHLEMVWMFLFALRFFFFEQIVIFFPVKGSLIKLEFSGI